ncbi:MAG: alpha-amylase, partial [Anaerolineae bacterium]|nr:alpha-amylase [Anaerolineae bacterium]
MKKAIVVFSLMLALQALALAPSAAQDSVPWWNNRVFYEIFVRSFYDSDGDGIGDLQGIIQKLDYLNDGDPTTTTDLGVTGLWLMPVAESPSYHGYDVTDYLMVEPDYGTDDDFRALVAAAHTRGIAVIVDVVVNHTSREHPWFQASAAGNPHYADWYIWDESCPTYRGPWGEVVWIPLDDRCYYAIFWEGMPDLNYTNPAVTSAMENVAHYWLTDMGADGFRLDALQHIVENGQNQANTDATHEWANAFHDTITSVKPDALSVGEIDANSYLAAPYVPDGADLVFAFDLADAMLQSANVGINSAVTTLQNRVVDLYPPNQYAAFLSNHDDNRSMNTLRHSVDKAKAAATLLLTQPGVP